MAPGDDLDETVINWLADEFKSEHGIDLKTDPMALQRLKETAEKATSTASVLINLAEQDRKKIQTIGRSSGSALRVHQALLQRPIISIPKICEITGLWTTSATTAIKHLEQIGMIEELTGGKRNRLYKYVEYIDILNDGTDVKV